MSAWIIFWGLVVLFSLLSFTFMSVRILIKSIAELKSMFRKLDERNETS